MRLMTTFESILFNYDVYHEKMYSNAPKRDLIDIVTEKSINIKSFLDELFRLELLYLHTVNEKDPSLFEDCYVANNEKSVIYTDKNYCILHRSCLMRPSYTDEMKKALDFIHNNSEKEFADIIADELIPELRAIKENKSFFVTNFYGWYLPIVLDTEMTLSEDPITRIKCKFVTKHDVIEKENKNEQRRIY